MIKILLLLIFIFNTNCIKLLAIEDQTHINEESEDEDDYSQYVKQQTKSDTKKQIKDPLEKINRVTFFLQNNILDYFIFRPLSIVYGKVVPETTKGKISNSLIFLNQVDCANSQVHFWQ